MAGILAGSGRAGDPGGGAWLKRSYVALWDRRLKGRFVVMDTEKDLRRWISADLKQKRQEG